MSAFVPGEFRDPPSFLWPAYFWMINDATDRETLRAQLEDMRRHDARSVLFHPMPAEFRPATMGTRMAPPYLSEAFFATVRDVVAHCRELGLNYWLYDEGGWPSGGAAGRVWQRNPAAFACRHLVAEDLVLPAGEPYVVPANFVCLAVQSRVYRPGEAVPACQEARPARAARVQCRPMLYDCGKTQAEYVDILHPDAAPTFVELTHRQYGRHLAEHFGDTIRFVFTDEPAASATRPPRQLTWTDDMPAAFRERKGYDLVPWLPALLAAPGPDEAPELTLVRLDFHDVWSRLFAERYLGPLREWCQEHGLLSSGHFGGEDEISLNATAGYGHILRALRGLDLPGIDAIWRQLFPGRNNRPFPQYASSVARQKGQPLVLTESFAVYGSGLTPAQMKWTTDYQYVRGATLTVVSNYPYSTAGNLMPGCRPHFGASNPLWRYMDLYHRYVARLSYLLTRGEPVCSTAVHIPIRSIWAGGEDRDRAVRQHEDLARQLAAAQCAFDFVDDDVLAGREGRAADGWLLVGRMRYDTVIVPTTRWMEEEALAGLEAFARGGGRIVAIDEAPRCAGTGRRLDAPCTVASIPEAVALLTPLVRVSPSCPALRATKRIADGKALYFLANESAESLVAAIEFPEEGPAAVCDPEEGLLRPLVSHRDHPAVVAPLSLPPFGSLAVAFGQPPDAPALPQSYRPRLDLATGWTLRPLRQYRVGRDDYESRDCHAAPVPAELGDWRPLLGDHFSGDAEYSLLFHWADEPVPGALLDLGLVRHACDVELNGHPLGRRIWSPFSLPVGDALRRGENHLRVVVTNTLANALCDPDVVADWQRRRGPGWPADGHPYDARAREFEAESLPSGLSGPVQILTPH